MIASTDDKYKPLKNIIAVKNLVQFYERLPDSKDMKSSISQATHKGIYPSCEIP
jgi:hypothetical protein